MPVRPSQNRTWGSLRTKLTNLSIDRFELLSARRFGATDDVKSLPIEANQDDNQWDGDGGNNSNYDDLDHAME
jgi:hypothetical protein